MVTDLELVADGRTLRFPAVWLRDNCPCRQCRDPGTGQKLIDATGIPNGLAITLIEDAGQSVRVTFGPGQHRSEFSRAWLAAHALDGDGAADGDGRTAAAALPARRGRRGRHRAGGRLRGRGGVPGR